MFCRKCGNQIPDDSQFCLKCGEKVVDVDIPPINEPVQIIPDQSSEMIKEAENGKLNRKHSEHNQESNMNTVKYIAIIVSVIFVFS